MKMDFSKGERTGLFTALWATLTGVAIYVGLPQWVVVFGSIQVIFSILSGFIYTGFEMQVAKCIAQTMTAAANNANTTPKG